MRLISTELSARNKYNVRNLHDVLETVLGRPVAADPNARKAFDADTERAIREAVDLGRDTPILTNEGRLDPRIAEAINARLMKHLQSDEAEVRTLHERLGLLRERGFVRTEIDRRELQRHAIGRTTAAALREVQERYGLAVTGEYDADTRARLQSVAAGIAARGVKRKITPMRKPGIARVGRTVGKLRLNMSSDKVAILQRNLAFLGYTIAADEHHAKTFGRTTRDAVLAFQRTHGLPMTGEGDRATANAINRILAGLRPAEVADRRYRVRGSVRDAMWNGLGGRRVRVSLVRVGGRETVLAERPTFADGFYDVLFDPGKAEPPFRLAVDVLDADGRVAARRVFRNTGRVAWANFTAGDAPYRGPSEFDRLLKDVGRGLEGAPLRVGDLEESARRRDISDLAQEIEIGPDEIMRLVLAHRLAEAAGQRLLDPAVFYGFVRQDLPPELPDILFPDAPEEWDAHVSSVLDRALDGLALMGPEALAEGLDAALRQNTVPRRVAAERDGILAALEELGTRRILDRPLLTGDGTLAEATGRAGLGAGGAGAVARTFRRFQALDEQFFTALEADEGLPHDEVRAFRGALDIGYVSNRHAPMVAAIDALIADPARPDVTRPSGLAKLGVDDWVALMEASGVEPPDGMDGGNVEERRRNFATAISERSHRLHPAIALTAATKRADAAVSDRFAHLDEVEALFDRIDDRDALRVNLAREAPELDDATFLEASAIRRVARMAPSTDAGIALMANGMLSAMQVYFRGQDRLIADLAEQGIDRTEAVRIYRVAEHQYSHVLAVVAQYRHEFHTANPALVPSFKYTPEELEEVRAEIPNLEVLFGNIDYCDCRLCGSVYGPAAYLSDVLRFLGEKPGVAPFASVFDGFNHRRPDVAKILLDCPNTNTEVRQIDLVNEVLEGAIPPEARDFAHQTTLPPEQLRVAPEHQRAAAYRVLRDASFPMHVGFDAWQSEMRLLLAHLRLPRHEIMEAFRNPQAAGGPLPPDHEIAAEYFGISTRSLELLTPAGDPATFPVQANIWGFDASRAEIPVAEILAAARITYQELVAVLMTAFVNPGPGPSAIVSDRPTCDPDEQRVTALSLAKLDRMHRFLRLWRHVDWSIRDLDLLVTAPALGDGTIDADCLVALRQAHLVQRALKLTAPELHAFYAEIDTSPRVSEDLLEAVPNLYEELFQSPAVSQPVDPAFALPLDGSPLAGHRDTLIAALAVTGDELDRLLPATDGTLSLASLSTLFRRARLARALGLGVGELVTLIAMSSDINPFASPSETLEFISRHEAIRRARISVGRLAYGLTHAADSPFGIREEVIAQHLAAFRAELVTLSEGAEPGEEPWRDRLGRQLARIDALSDGGVRETALDLIQMHWAGTEAERIAFIAERFGAFIPADANPAAVLTGGGPAPDAVLTPAQEAEVLARAAFVAGHLHAWLTRKTAVRFAAGVMALPDQVSAVLLGRLALPGGAVPLIDVIRGPALTAQGADGAFTNALEEAALPDHFLALRVLHQAAAVIASLSVTADDLEWLIDHHGEIGAIDLGALPVAAAPAQPLLPAWLATQELLAFRTSHPDPEGASLLDVLARAADPANAIGGIVADLALVMQWDAGELDALRLGIGLRHGAGELDFAKPRTYTRLARCRDMIRLSGTDVATHLAWATRAGAAAEEARSETARRAVKSKYSHAEWLRRIEPIADEMRERRRDALVGWLIETSRRNEPRTVAVGGQDVPNLRRWDTPQDVSAWFLMDVEMSSCQASSRIKFAIGSVQTFVQRAFLDLEKEFVRIPRDDPDTVNSWTQWRWLKSVRLRRASLEIFYHGENWIDPRLRHDKSEFFVELEQELMQNEMTPDNVEAAFRSYVEKLDEVANLEIVSLFHDYFTTPETLHVIGRTRSIPHTYHHRTYDLEYGIWTPWEKVGIDIESDNVACVVYNRRLHLFWLEVKRKPNKVTKNPPVADPSKSSDRPDPPDLLEIELAWSVRRQSGWGPRQQSRLKLIHPWPRPMFSYHVKPRHRPADNTLWIDIFVSTSPEFNATKYYDQYMAAWRKLTKADYRETYRPWHSSSFAFDGSVKRVLQRGIQAQYYMPDHGKVVPTDSYAHVSSNFGEDGRAIEELTSNDRQPALKEPPGLHFERNYLTNNKVHAPNATQVHIPTSTGSRHVLAGGNAPFRVVLPMQSLQTRPFVYQDNRRSFFIKNEWRTIQTGYNTSEITAFFAFYPLYHPYSQLFLRELDRAGVDGLLRRPMQTHPHTFHPQNNFAFAGDYLPVHPHKADPTAETDRLDFTVGGAYSLYNWEIFFHAPMLIAMRLNEERRFEDAMRWYRYIFDPTSTDNFPSPQRFWITKPFFDHSSEDYRKQRLTDLAAGLSGHDPAVTAWKNDPFRPHLVARHRPVMYQRAVAIRFVQNLMDWGDALFRRDTIEDINEATQLYLLASEILGPAPRRLPAVHRDARSFEELEAEGLDAIGNALVDTVAENQIGLPIHVAPTVGEGEPLPRLELNYFCVPPNEELLRTWDKLAERLWNIRNCRNIEGIERQLALWEPRIDPALLVKAAAAGIDIGSVLDDLAVPAPHYRPQALLPVAVRFCASVQQFGATLLRLLEAGDAEGLARMRATHEAGLMREIRALRDLQIDEATAAREILDHTRRLSEIRRDNYAARSFMNAAEIIGAFLSGGSIVAAATGTVLDAVAAFSYLIPDLQVGGAGVGGSPVATATVTGGYKIGKSLEAGGRLAFNIGTVLEKGASMSREIAGYQRRKEEWDLQVDLAEEEIKQADAQIAAADIRISIAEHDERTAQLQVDQADAVEEYIRYKFTSSELYQWQINRLSTVYFEAYRLAFDMAKRVERSIARDLCRTDLSYVQFGYWDSLKKGLTAGDQLLKALMEVEAAYIQQNRRRLELTKHISLATEAPLAFQELISTGRCFFDLGEPLFDRDHPGHILRCIKSLAVTVAGVTGPYTGIHGELHMLGNRVRVSNVVGDAGYPMTGPDDGRFRLNVGTLDTMAISHGQSDPGLFERNLEDPRFLWFEGAGAISSWSLAIPQESNAFALSTLSDVILTLQYYALPGGTTIEAAARDHLASLDGDAGMILLSARHRFGTEWHRFLFPDAGEQRLVLDLGERHYPFRARGRTITLTRLVLFVDGDHAGPYVGDVTLGGAPAAVPLSVEPDPAFGGTHVQDVPLAPPAIGSGIGPVTIRLRKGPPGGDADFVSLGPDDIRDVVVIARYALS